MADDIMKLTIDSSDVVTATDRVEDLESAVTRSGKSSSTAAGGLESFSKAGLVGGKRMNTFNMRLQQGGYQLQDFVVQLQSGTSVFTAFGQQGSQFAGIFGPKGAVIGAVIAIGSAVGGMAYKMLTASSEVKDFKGQMDDLTTALSDYEAVSNRIANDAALSGEFGRLSDNAKSILQSIRELNNISLKDMLGEFGSLGEIKLEKVTLRDPTNKEGFLGLLGFNTKELEVFGAKQIKKAADFLQLEDTGLNYGEQASEAQKYLRLVMAIQQAEDLEGRVGPAKELSDYLAEMVNTRDLDVDKREEILRLQKVLLKITEAQAKLEKPAADAKTKAEEEYQKRLARTRVLMGKLVAERKAAAAAEAEEDRLANIQTLADAERDLFKKNLAYEKNQKALDAAGDKAILENQANAELELSRTNDAYEKMSDAERQKRLDELNDKVEEMAERLSIPFAAALGLIRQAKEEATVGLDAFGGSGSFKYGGSQTFKPDPEKIKRVKKSDLQILKEQLQLEDALLGKTEARQRVIQALGVKFVEDNPKTVAGLEAQITANENLLRIEEERKRMNDLVTDSMENGLMAMADGTKTVSDAFRDMAREIIAELYRILVVQQMVNAAKSFFGFPFADGGAFSGGSQIQAYADGGVVGSPTLFPMAGGKTGLMGEAGPEAIMPLKRGANGKLGVQMEGGGGDNVVINQSFNFQANGDDSVKKIIAQAAPQIAQMTKNSMLNDRRRGGTTKAVFG